MARLLHFIKPCPAFRGRAFAPGASSAREAREVILADRMAFLKTHLPKNPRNSLMARFRAGRRI
jgi:hypothetical protein